VSREYIAIIDREMQLPFFSDRSHPHTVESTQNTPKTFSGRTVQQLQKLREREVMVDKLKVSAKDRWRGDRGLRSKEMVEGDLLIRLG
jgi:hypothetical protein